MKRENERFKVLLGYTKKTDYGSREPVYLNGFSWDCEWYWGGGYIGNKNFHAHFNGAFLDCPDTRGHCLGNFFDPWQRLPEYLKEEDVKRIPNGAAVWENAEFFLDDVPERISDNWWRIKDLYKQFYALKEAAEIFHLGGHCTNTGRNPAEINKAMEDKINDHIQTVIIPEIVKVLTRKEGKGNSR